MDNWTANSAEIVKVHLDYPTKIQQEIAKIINISQDAVSKRMKRANLDEILELNQMYKSELANTTEESIISKNSSLSLNDKNIIA